MSKKGRSKEDEAAKAEAKAEAAAKAAGQAPLVQRAFGGLAGLKQAMDAEAAAKAKAEAEKRARAEARGERVAPAKKPATQMPVGPAVKRPGATDVWRPDLDKELYSVAMSGVVPLAAKGKAGRVRAEGAGHAGHAHGAGPHHGAGTNAKLRRAQAEGAEVIPVRWSEDGRCEAARKGRTFALEALGRFAAAQDELDLHGMAPEEAQMRVAEFVRTRRARGLRVVSVVHGVGRHAPDGACVLRDAAVRALSEPPGSREVDAFKSAEDARGDAGALLVALRGA